MSIISWSTCTGMLVAVLPTVIFYVLVVRGFERSAEGVIQEILIAQEQTSCRVNEIIIRLRERGKNVQANRLAACSKRQISMMQFRTYLLTIEDQCRLRHPELWRQLQATYGISET